MVGSNEALNNLSRINPTHDVIENQIKALVSASLGAISEVRIGKYMGACDMLLALRMVWLDLQRAKANVMSLNVYVGVYGYAIDGGRYRLTKHD